MRIRNIFAIKVIFILTIVCSLSWAGNEEIIEERIEELDSLNKEAIEQVPDIPENGKINLKATVIQKDGTVDLTILQKEIEAVETKSSAIRLGSYKQKNTEKEKGNIGPDNNLKEEDDDEEEEVNEEGVSVDNSQPSTENQSTR